MACAPLSFGGDFVGDALGFVDCQAATLGASGFGALAAPGSIGALLLTGLLTLFVAGFGYRMLLGDTPDVRTGVTAFVKIGFVLALATGWGPYRTLVYDVALRGPAELTAAIGAPAGLPGSGGDLAVRLGLVDQALVQLNDLGVGRPRTDQAGTRNRQVAGSDQIIVESSAGRANPIEPYAFGLARVLFLVGAVGALGAVRLFAGLLLALGPVFVAFALFDSTRGLFEGWVRGLAGAFLGAIAAAAALAAELAMAEGWIAELLTRRLANESVSGAAVELVVVTLAFDLILVALLVASARVAAGFRLPQWHGVEPRAVPASAAAPIQVRRDLVGQVTPSEQHSRARAIADGVAGLQRREAAAATAAARGGGREMAGGTRAGTVAGVAAPSRGRDDATAAATPLGRSMRRRPVVRGSASAGRRDQRA